MKKFFTHVFLLAFLFSAFGVSKANAQVNHLVISQVYGGGGNSGATYKNDFIEIFNPTSTAVDVTGWSVQYASSSGTSWSVTSLAGTVAAGGYYLVQEAAGSGGTVDLPTPDAVGTSNLSGTNGKVGLSNTSAALTGTCPAGGTVVDFVGFGSSANCFEGAGATPTLSNTTSASRSSNGCTDTDNNSADFSAVAPNPRNSSSPANICGTAVATVSVASGASAAEPSANGSFTINFSSPTTVATDVNFAYSGSATFGTDYTISYSTGSTTSITATGTLTVPQGTPAVTITVTPINDALVEGDETISLALSSPGGGYVLGTSSADITIADDDVPTVSIAPGNNAAEPATNGTFNIILSDPAPAGGVTVNYSLAGSATLNADYSDPQSGTMTIPAGSTTGFITLNTIDDAVYEGTEAIEATLTGASNSFVIANASASIDILDNETPPAIVINEVYGGGGNSGADYKNDFIELYNPGTIAVNLTGWSVQYASSTGTSWQVTALAGSIAAKGYYLIQEAAGSGGTTDLPTPDATGGIAMSGTNGKVALVANATALSGSCPTAVVDEVGYGSANCFEGTAAAPVLTNTTSDQRTSPGYDTNNNNTDFVTGVPTPKNSVIDLTAPTISSVSPANNATAVLTSFTATMNFSENVQAGTGSILLKKVSDGSTVKTIDVTSATVTVTGSAVSFDINSLAFNTNYYFEINAGAFVDANNNPFAGITGATTWNFTTSATPPAGVLGTTYDFNTCAGGLTDGFTQFNVLGAQVWGCTAFGRDPSAPSGTAAYPNAVKMNGYANGINNKNEDWLISPSFDLTGTSYPLLSFWSRTAYTGSPLELKVSTDYTGTGDPNLATWTDINGKFPSQVSDTWTLSDNINLSAYKSAHTYFAFVYTSTTDDGARWTLDDIQVANSATPPPPSLTVSATDIQYTFVANGATSDKTFTFTGNDLTGGVTLNATGDFLLSKDGSAFSQAITYTLAEANDNPENVFVRFAPSAANQAFPGFVTISTDGAVTDTINLNGSSIDPATTLEVVNWNMEWFGSTTLGPADDNLQEQNAATVIDTIGADIYGLLEVVDEARLQQVVNSLNDKYGAGTYSSVVCNYGSHVNPPEPNGSLLGEVQKEAFIYKTALFSNVTTRPLIFNEDVSSPSYNYWSSGRYPFLMTADVTLNCVTRRINFVLIHAKANTAPTATAYARRQAAANELHDTLSTYFANENVIVLGDFNDDLDQTITAGLGFTTTSYSSFTNDIADFFFPTLALSLEGKKSTVTYNDIIDHVILNKDMEPYYLPGSATILTDVASLINKYGTTTSDHYPVFTRYIFPNTTAPTVTSCTPEVSYCSNSTGTYSIPVFKATDDCNDAVIYSYVITGATERSGTTNDATGDFATGTSTITWTGADSWGNKSNCSTTVTINETPGVTIADSYALSNGTDVNTVYIGYAPASGLNITANASGGITGYTYSWTAEQGLAIKAGTGTMQTVTVSATGSGNYSVNLSVTVTDSKGCSVTKTVVIGVKDVRGGNKNEQVVVCHSGSALIVAADAVPAHLNHGDRLGSCSDPAKGTWVKLLDCILSNFPNPFHDYTTIRYSLSLDCAVSVKIYDLYGREITTLFNGNKKAGSYTADFNASKLAKGIYMCKITAVSNDQSSVETRLLFAK